MYLPTAYHVSPNCTSCISFYKIPCNYILPRISQLYIMYLILYDTSPLHSTMYLPTVYHVSSSFTSCISFYKIPCNYILPRISQLYIMYLSTIYHVSPNCIYVSHFIKYLAIPFYDVSPNCISCISQLYIVYLFL